MGICFNPTNESFEKDTNSEIYIDKTGLLEYLNKIIGTAQNCICVSHARRFGKSQAAGMIDAYYSKGSDSKNLFEGFEISESRDFEKYLNKYNVIHWDISSVADFHKDDLVQECVKRLCDDVKKVYGKKVDYSKDINVILNDIYNQSRIQFVIIIDEWDCVIRNHSDRQDLVHSYLQFLHAIFKSEESKRYLALAYITGILPIKKIKDESALNNFHEFTMINSKNLAQYYGFTEKEVQDLCRKYQMDFDSIKEWYDGYQINGQHMYNPNSVYQAMVDRELDSYWKNTSAFDLINQYITLNYDGLKDNILEMLTGKKVRVNTNSFQNDFSLLASKDDALTALIHLGYLGYDKERGLAYIPNYEARGVFGRGIACGD